MNENNTSKYVIGVVALVVLAVGTVVFMQKNSEAQPVDNGSSDTASTPKTGTFSGTISAIDTGCFADAVCSVTVDGKKVILTQGGLSSQPNAVVGKLVGVNSIGDLEDKIGAFANVFAGVTPEGNYTLYGNSAYYVEVAEISDK